MGETCWDRPQTSAHHCALQDWRWPAQKKLFKIFYVVVSCLIIILPLVNIGLLCYTIKQVHDYPDDYASNADVILIVAIVIDAIIVMLMVANIVFSSIGIIQKRIGFLKVALWSTAVVSGFYIFSGISSIWAGNVAGIGISGFLLLCSIVLIVIMTTKHIRCIQVCRQCY